MLGLRRHCPNMSEYGTFKFILVSPDILPALSKVVLPMAMTRPNF
jgi:hypothetical protein